MAWKQISSAGAVLGGGPQNGLGWGAGLGWLTEGSEQRAVFFRALRPRPAVLWGRSQLG